MGLASGHPVTAKGGKHVPAPARGPLVGAPMAPRAEPKATPAPPALDLINALARLEAYFAGQLETWATTPISSEEHRQRKLEQLRALRADVAKLRRGVRGA